MNAIVSLKWILATYIPPVSDGIRLEFCMKFLVPGTQIFQHFDSDSTYSVIVFREIDIN